MWGLAMAALQSKSMTCDWGLKCRGALVELKRAAHNMYVCMHACIARSGLHRSGDCVALRVVGECVGGKCVVAFVASRA